MLSVMTAVKGSAGYVAIEQVIGQLCGKQGSCVLQHFGVMTDGQNRLILVKSSCYWLINVRDLALAE